jgi:Zn ribbon nucleic-acid-binding protein
MAWFKNKGQKKYKARVLTAEEVARDKRRERRRQERIPKDIKRMLNANFIKTAKCPKCGETSERRADLWPDKEVVTVYYMCWKCGWTSRTRTILYPKKAREMVSNASSIGIKTWRGIRFRCPKCRSERVKLIIEPEYVKENTVTFTYKCASCGWGAIKTLSIVRR